MGSVSCWNTIGIWGNEHPKCDRLAKVLHCSNCDVYISAGRQAFEKPTPDGYDEEWKEHLAAQETTVVLDDLSGIIFRIGDEWFLLSTKYFNEVSEDKKIHPIPHFSGGKVKGVVNIRGKIQVCFSASQVLGVDSSSFSQGQMNSSSRVLVTAFEGQTFIFPVDEIKGVFRYREALVKELPSTLLRSDESLLEGVLNVEDINVACINPSHFFMAMGSDLS